MNDLLIPYVPIFIFHNFSYQSPLEERCTYNVYILKLTFS